MLKVSLLPESYRRKITGAKKKEQVKKISLIALIMLFVFFVVVLGTKQYVSEKYSEINGINAEAKAMFPVLEKYQVLYDEIQAQKNLIDVISAKEPHAHDFVVNLGNIDVPGLWLKKISANDWFYTKQCIVEGNCLSYEGLLDYIERIKEIEGVLDVAIDTFAYTTEETETDDRICEFTITITCDGASAPIGETEASTKATTGSSTEATTGASDTTSESADS